MRKSKAEKYKTKRENRRVAKKYSKYLKDKGINLVAELSEYAKNNPDEYPGNIDLEQIIG